MTVLLKRSMFFFPIVLVMGQAALQPVVVKDCQSNAKPGARNSTWGVRTAKQQGEFPSRLLLWDNAISLEWWINPSKTCIPIIASHIPR